MTCSIRHSLLVIWQKVLPQCDDGTGLLIAQC